MVKKIISRSKKILTTPQSSIFSAASIIMLMIIASKILGFVRQRTLFTFFDPTQTDLFLAAFELPDLIFEIFVFGVLSAAFIPVFSKYLSRDKEAEAWHVAASSLNILLVIFSILGIIVFIFAKPLYTLVTGNFIKDQLGVAGGFSSSQIKQVVALSRLLLVAQLFFVASSLMTGVLESHKRFIIPAIAPLFYNLSIILGTIFLSKHIGLYAPTIGAVIGALIHFLIQAPFAYELGFRPKIIWDLKHKGVKKLIKLATPRMIELSFFQVRRLVWLFLASVLPGGFTYLKSADLLQTLPVGVFGLSLAKASLPTLSQQVAKKDFNSFRKTFYSTLNQILFFVIPFSVFLAVFRIPVVRLIFGAQRFNWSATIQTGYILTAFAIGIFAYAGSLLVSRSFYALQDTKTPVAISILSVLTNTILGFVLILGLKVGTWGIALSYSIAGVLQFSLLTLALTKKIHADKFKIIIPLTKIIISSLVSGAVMYFLLKIFDRSVWIKKLSFLGKLESTSFFPFERFVLDTRYTINLLILTTIVSTIGLSIYLILSILLGLDEVYGFFNLIKKIFVKHKVASISEKEEETITPPPSDTTQQVV